MKVSKYFVIWGSIIGGAWYLLQPARKSIELDTSKILGKNLPENQQQLSKFSLRNFKKWLRRFLTPTAFCTAIIAACTIVYTYMMWDYTKATYGLLEATKVSNVTIQKLFYVQNRPYIYIHTTDLYMENNGQQVLKLVIKNSGNIPARNIEEISNIIVDNVSKKEFKSFSPIAFPQTEYQVYIMFDDEMHLYINKMEIIFELRYIGMDNEKHHTKEKVYLSESMNMARDKIEFHISTNVIESD
jgi:hypothetical protein